MRILLNLLPEEKQRELSRKFYSRFFLWQTCLILVLVIFYATVLGGIYFLLNYQVKGAQLALESFNQYNQESRKLTEYQEAFRQANNLSADITQYLDQHHQWGGLFLLLERLTPAGVSLTGLSTKDYTVSIAGRADTRDQFLAFEAALKAVECTSDVKVPLSNLFAQTELDFQIDFNIKKECLLNRN